MLQRAYEQGHNDALARFGVKLAMMPPVAESPFAMPSMRGAASAFGRGARTLGKGIGIGALGLAGAGALAVHHQNKEDRENLSLVNAPLSGSYA